MKHKGPIRQTCLFLLIMILGTMSILAACAEPAPAPSANQETITNCRNLLRLNALVIPGEVIQFDVFNKDFCLTDVVMDLWTFPEGQNSKASCGIWLVTPAQGTSEVLFQCRIDKYGHQIHLNSGVFCPKGSYLTANSGIFAEGETAELRVLLTGYYC